MPNWVYNKITIDGYVSKEQIDILRELDSGGDFPICSRYMPEPEYDNESDWYDWRRLNWDTNRS